MKPAQKKAARPPQKQATQPGRQKEMTPAPKSSRPQHQGTGKLKGKVAIITGGDSGIGRAVAILFAREGANIVIVYLNEHDDAGETRRLVEKEGVKCHLISGDVGQPEFCTQVVDQAIGKFKKLDILVNNAAEQHPQEDFANVTPQQVEATFRTNILSMFFLTHAVLPHLKEGSAIVNTTSVTAYRGSPHLVDYASTKGAIVGFTRALALNLAGKKIRVNGVAPGPIWTPLIPSTFDEKKVESFGQDVPLKRAGEPEEVAPCYLFLASDDSSYMTGQVLHPNGGEIING